MKQHPFFWTYELKNGVTVEEDESGEDCESKEMDEFSTSMDTVNIFLKDQPQEELQKRTDQ